MTDLAQLGLEIDSRQAASAAADLDRLAASAGKAAGAADEVAGRYRDAGGRLREANGRFVKMGESLGDLPRRTRPAARGLDDVGDAANRANRAVRGFNAGPLSQQLNQIVQQGAATGNYVQAFAIQAADIGASFGALGAAAGLAATLLIPMGARLLGLGNDAETAGAALDRFHDTIDSARGFIETAKTPIQELRQEYGALAETVQAAAQRMVGLRLEGAIGEVAAALDPLAGDMDRVINLMDALAAKSAEIAALEAVPFGQRDIVALATAQDTLGLINSDLTELQTGLGLTAGEAERVRQALDGVRGAESFDQATAAAAEFVGWVDRAYETTDRLPDVISTIYPYLADMVAAGARVTEEAERAGIATGEMGDSLSMAQTAWDAMTGPGLSQSIASAASNAGLLETALTRALAPLQQAQGWLSGLFDGLGQGSTISIQGLAGATSGVAASADILRQFEGFRASPYYDVNAYRVGYGSDTVTLADGSVQAVVQGMSVSVADANRDLVRRIEDFQAGIVSEIGADRWASLIPAQQAALTSLAYNYGSLPDRVAAAVASGSTVAIRSAILGLQGDNGGINAERRRTEASIFAGGFGTEEAALRQEAEAASLAAEATRDAERANRDAAREAERLATAYDGLLASINPAADASQKLAEAQAAVDAAVASGRTSVERGREVMNAYALDLAVAATRAADVPEAVTAATEAAAEQADAMQGILTGAIDQGLDHLLDRFRSTSDGLLGILHNMLVDMAAMLIKNRLSVSLGLTAAVGGSGGGAGLLGGIGGALGGFGTGLGNVASGLLSGGLGGAGAAISTALGGATSGLAGLATAAGALAGPIGLAVLAFSAFRKKTTELDAGFRVTIDGVDALVESFRKTRTSRLFGLISSRETDFGPANEAVAGPVRAALDAIRDTVGDAAQALGLEVDAYRDVLTISTKGMTPEQAAQEVQRALGGVSDSMAKLALGGLTDLSRTGETATQTLGRVAGAFTSANAALRSIGLRGFGRDEAGIRGAAGVGEGFGAAVDAYRTGVLPPAEQRRLLAGQLDRALEAVGVRAVPASLEAFRALVERISDKAKQAAVLGLTPLMLGLQGLRDAAREARVESVRAAQDAREAAQEALAARREGLIDQRQGLRERLWQAQGRTDLIRQAQLAELTDRTSQAILRQIFAQEDMEAATEAAARAADEAASKLREMLGALDMGDFASRFAFDVAGARIAQGLDRPANLTAPPVAAPGATPAAPSPETAALREEVRALDARMATVVTLLVGIENHTAGTRATVRKFDKDGMPKVRSA